MADEFDLVREWEAAKLTRDEAVAREQELRRLVREKFFADAKKGTHRIELLHGWKLKCVAKENISFTSRDDLDAALDAIERSPEAGGEFIAQRVVKWVAELSESEFKKAPEAAQQILSRCIIRKPGTPSLEIEAPKV